MRDSVGVVGLGYEGLSIDEFCAQVVQLNVNVVVDVRLNALSRKRGFSKNGLRTALTEVGVEYVHRPVLGNPRDNRDGFALPGSRAGDAARDRYRAYLKEPDAIEAIRELAALARASRVAVVCFERDQHECHRELVIAGIEGRQAELLEPVRN